MTIPQCQAELDKINSIDADTSRLDTSAIFRYVNLTEYRAIMENLTFFLKKCPHSLDPVKNETYLKYLKSYLIGIRYLDTNFINFINLRINEIQRDLIRDDMNSLYTNVKSFLLNEFIPKWISIWNK